jgi:hypothetical protein
MTKRTRRNHGSVFKSKVALEAIKGEQTLREEEGSALDKGQYEDIVKRSIHLTCYTHR